MTLYYSRRPWERFGGTHAVVIGASTTGLVSAAVAARHFDRVTVIERDLLPDRPLPRKGVPQSRHVHVLLRGGENVMNHYFPGLTPDLVANGSVYVDMAADTWWHHSGGWKQRFPSGVGMLCQTKGFLEWYIRQRVQQLPNVALQSGVEVRGYDALDGRINAVHLSGDRRLEADLVIDASGRNSRTPQHLRTLGFAEVPVTMLEVDIGYATRPFRRVGDHAPWKALLVHPRLPESRLGVLLPVEDDRWLVTLVGWRGDHPADEPEGFLDFARSLAVPDLYHAIEHAEPLDRIRLYRFPANLRRHYEKVSAGPEGLVVVGDAACSVNPIYGQGMSQGAIGAMILDACLSDQRHARGRPVVEGLFARFSRRYAEFLDECWMISTTEDYGTDSSADSRKWWAPLMNWYMGRVQTLTWKDRQIAQRFIEVMHMLRPPASLFSPAIAWRALVGG